MNACGQPNSVRSQGDPWSESAGSKERTLTSLRSIGPWVEPAYPEPYSWR